MEERRREAKQILYTLQSNISKIPERAMRMESFSHVFVKQSQELQGELLHLLVMYTSISSEYLPLYFAFFDMKQHNHYLSSEEWKQLQEQVERWGYRHVARLLASRPHFVRKEEEHLRPHPDLAELSLGERKALARQHNIHMLEKLLLDPNKHVIRLLLQNPRITEKEVLYISTKRPNQRYVLEEIAKHSRWYKRTHVQTALCRNPYTPQDLVLQFLPALPTPTLREMLDPPPRDQEVQHMIEEIIKLREVSYSTSQGSPHGLNHQQIISALVPLKKTGAAPERLIAAKKT